MKKIICPNCGEVPYYAVNSTERYRLLFDENGEPCGATDAYKARVGRIKFCCQCGVCRVQIIEDGEQE